MIFPEDIAFIPKRNTERAALIVELKWNQDAKTAISQIKDKKYPDSLKEYKGNMLLVRISYDKKPKEHRHKIEKCPLLDNYIIKIDKSRKILIFCFAALTHKNSKSKIKTK